MPQKFALLVGNSSFRHAELQRLSAPSTDVRALAELLEDPDIAGFDSVDLKLDVSLVDARAAIGGLYRNKDPDDLLLFYYSGHGLRDLHGTFYLALTETDPADPDSGSLDEQWLRSVMNKSASQRQLTILDCCHSGALIPSNLVARNAATGPVITRETFDPNGHGRYIMTATTADTSAFEHDGRSLYTSYLVEGLKTGLETLKNDFISVQDLHSFVRDKVAREVSDLMMPQLWADASTNPEPLFIARNRGTKESIGDTLKDQLFSESEPEIELAFYRLKDIILEEKKDLESQAIDLLKSRLDQCKELSFDLGIKIYSFLEKHKCIPGHDMSISSYESKIEELEGKLKDTEKDWLTKQTEWEVQKAILEKKMRDHGAVGENKVMAVYSGLRKFLVVRIILRLFTVLGGVVAIGALGALLVG